MNDVNAKEHVSVYFSTDHEILFSKRYSSFLFYYIIWAIEKVSLNNPMINELYWVSMVKNKSKYISMV